MAYDNLRAKHTQSVADRQYLNILYMAATENEIAVEGALRQLLGTEEPISIEAVKKNLQSDNRKDIVDEVRIDDVALAAYDDLLESSLQGVANG